LPKVKSSAERLFFFLFGILSCFSAIGTFLLLALTRELSLAIVLLILLILYFVLGLLAFYLTLEGLGEESEDSFQEQLEVKCEYCGTWNSKEDKYCRKCGKAIP